MRNSVSRGALREVGLQLTFNIRILDSNERRIEMIILKTEIFLLCFAFGLLILFIATAKLLDTGYKFSGLFIMGTIFLIAVSFMFGGEPMIARYPPDKNIPSFTFKQYMDSAKKQGYNSLLGKTIITIAYPSAKLVTAIHNSDVPYFQKRFQKLQKGGEPYGHI